MSRPQAIYRKDYQPSAYLIRTTDLDFDLSENQTIVKSVIRFYKNPQSNKGNELFLNGVDLELLSITINDKTPDYQLLKDGLKLSQLNDEFVLKITTRIHPENNTSLNGLYQSNGNFCTQCEAQGFRQITYYLDRPDVLSVFTTHIKADANHYPLLLSNGNLIDSNSGKVTWYDPAPKPCYLFALVAGDFKVLEDNYTTKNGVEVALKIYVEAHNIDKTQFAMDSLKRAFAWDEARFNLEYDLDIYMIVAVDDFNMGAMENKGLNIFNSSCVLSSQKTATDEDYLRIEAVIAHEYFHNWTGNRVTCKDWFQLSLKEGLTVFREQEFSADMHDFAMKRIEDVAYLKAYQFDEDSSPLRHPVRPESYIEMNNFYTMTVYEKGAEIVRMLHTMLGEANFQQGMALYFQRFDGLAVEIEDFVRCMCDVQAFDFDGFMLWYSTHGTPKINIKNQNNHITITQNDKRLIPIKYGILNENGKQITQGMLVLDKTTQQFDFSHLGDNLHFSWLRDFSAPVIIEQDLSVNDLGFLARFESNVFTRFESMQSLHILAITQNTDINFIVDKLLDEPEISVLSVLFVLPTFEVIAQTLPKQDPHWIYQQKNHHAKQLAQRYQDFFLQQYQAMEQAYRFDTQAILMRKWRNTCLYYLTHIGRFDLAYSQFKNCDCMSDKLASFNCILSENNPYIDEITKDFYTQFADDELVLNKWFSAQAGAKTSDLNAIKKLLKHPKFNLNNPNKARALLAQWANNINFHQDDGYQFLADMVLKLDAINPQIAARLVSNLTDFNKFKAPYKNAQKQQLERIFATKNLSNNVFEVVQTALK